MPPASFELLESKLHAPLPRPGVFTRTATVERLVASRQPSVIAVVAPAGYGKTTVLAQWAERKLPNVAWVSADDRDNDPAVLLTYLAVALDRVEPIDPRLFRSLCGPGAGISDVSRLVASIDSMSHPVTLVLDHAEALTSRASRDVLAELAMCLPDGSQLAIASRHDLPVPVPRLRAQGGLVEIGVDELAMDRAEAQALLLAAGIDLPASGVAELVERTEGWPTGLYLAALALNARRSQRDADFVFTGDDRFMSDYLRSEILDHVSRADVSFLTRTSILDRLSGPLCDATVGSTSSGRVLDRLERRNLLVVPLDRRREWYRYHHLFRELLHAQLLRREPEFVRDLQLRAAAWYEANDLAEEAIPHAQHAGDATAVAQLVLKVAHPVWASGRVHTVLDWMAWFSANDLIEQHPAVAVHGALMHTLVGNAGEADRWAAAAERTSTSGMMPDGNTMEGSLAYLRALLCRDGVDAMGRDARTALQGLSPRSPYRAAMLHAEGLSHLLRGDPGTADQLFGHAVDEATSAGVAPFIPVLLAEHGIVAIERDDWAAAEALAAEALKLVRHGEFEGYWTSGLVFAWAARVASHRGDVEQARELVKQAANLRPLLTYAIPVVPVQALLELARAYIAIGDAGGVSAALRQINDILRHRPALGSLADEARQVRTTLDKLKGEMVGASSLTTAELRLLPLLPTHLTYVEISERLFVSRHTVKTQAISIYRKFGVSSRSDAIMRMQELGLVAHA